jgi:hypothetical protein
VREPAAAATLGAVQESDFERLGAVNLLLRVTRGSDNRLTGTVRTTSREDIHPFSGTLELMRVFEELVPAQRGAPGSDTPAPAGQVEPGRGTDA